MPEEKELLFKVRRNDGTHEWVIYTNGETAGFPADTNYENHYARLFPRRNGIELSSVGPLTPLISSRDGGAQSTPPKSSTTTAAICAAPGEK